MYTAEHFLSDLSRPYTFPGSYPRYFITSDGAALSYAAAKERKDDIVTSIRHGFHDGWLVVGCEVNYENDITCSHTGKKIESAYG